MRAAVPAWVRQGVRSDQSEELPMLRAIGVLLLAAAFCRPAAADELKTSRVALFTSGVGYFESAFNVEGDSTTELQFRIDQINDVLKSLVLRDLDGGSISAVQYPSRDPVEKALKSFAVDITGMPTLGDLLNQLRGVQVEIKAPSPLRGSIVGVEREMVQTGEKTVVERQVLVLQTEEGLRAFTLRELTAIKILDAKLEGELKKALETLAGSHDSEKKTVELKFAGQGKRRALVSYLLETPVWKTSYRLVLAEGKKPYLQGWAIVENATEQDWENVRLSLVSGSPISFTMDLYQSLYAQRPFERMAMYSSLRAPVYEASEQEAGLGGGRYVKGQGGGRGGPRKSASPAAPGAKAEGGMFQGGPGEESGKPASRMSRSRVPVIDIHAGEADADGLADYGVNSLASAEAAGELFEYTIQTPVSLKRQHSAMLPIATTEVEGSKLSIFNPATHVKHPLNGLRLKNTSGLYLMQGPITIFDGNAYAGDAKLPDLQKNEERLVAYALDLAVDVDVKLKTSADEVVQVWIAKGMLCRRRKLVDEREYSVRNKGDTARTLLIEQDIPDTWQLIEPKAFEEKAGTVTRFKVEVPPQQTQTLAVKVEAPNDETFKLMEMNDEQIGVVVRQRVISEPVKQAIARMVELQTAFDETQQQVKQIEGEIKTIGSEQKRIRENMTVLSETSEVRKRYEKKLNDQETSVETLRERLAGLRKQEETQRKALEDYVLSLSVQ
jgi:hypothetical protein